MAVEGIIMLRRQITRTENTTANTHIHTHIHIIHRMIVCTSILTFLRAFMVL